MRNADIPRALVLGATGRTGAAVVKTLEATAGQAVPVRASRSKATVEQWNKEGKEAVRIDLDDPDTFPGALEGIDRVFLMTGYTSAMNHQTKTLVDAAENAGVGFLVHLGVFSDGRSTDPHFAWHELVERYIAGSKLAWANVHPHVFMARMEQIVAAGPARWSIIRAPMLTNGPLTGQCRFAINSHLSRPRSISRADLAHYMLAHVLDHQMWQATVEISN